MPSSVTPLSPDQIKEMHLEKHGTQIAKTLLDLHEGWNELESDPGLWELLIRDLAGPDIIDVKEVLEVNEGLRSQVGDGEIYGIILLYLVDDRDRNQRSYNKELGSKFERNDTIINSMFFPLQKVPNACATYAALSVLLNSPSLPLGELLTDFKDFTKGMPPEEKGYAVGNSAQIAAFHNRRAPVTSSYAASVAAKPGTSRVSSTYIIRQTQQFHFVPYVPVNGDLMELDGLREFPISHGPIASGEDWTEKCRKVIGERMKKSTGHNYTLLVVKSCRRTKCIADTAMVQNKILQNVEIIKRDQSELETVNCKVEEITTFIETFEKRESMSSHPGQVPIDLLPTTYSATGLCDFMQDLVQKILKKSSTMLKEAEEKLESLVDRKDGIPPRSRVNSVSLVAQTALPSSTASCHNAEVMVVTEVMPGVIRLPSLSPVLGDAKARPKFGPSSRHSPVEQYAPGYSLRSSGSRVSTSTNPDSHISFHPSKKTRQTPQEAPYVDAKTDSLDQVIMTLTKHLTHQKTGNRRKNSRFASIKQEEGLKTPENGSGGAHSAGSSRAVSVLSSGISDITTPPAAGMVTRGVSRSTSFSSKPLETLLATSSGRSATVMQIKQESVSPVAGKTAPLKMKFKINQPSSSGLGAAARDLEETQKSVEKRKLEQRCFQNILDAIEEIKALEEQRVTLYEAIVEENTRRSTIEDDAEERECDHDAWITVLLKRMFEIPGLVTDEELEALMPMDVRKKVEGTPDSDLSLRTSAQKRTAKRAGDTGSVLKSKVKKFKL